LLPNGNILAVSAFENRAYEITRDGATVWEWNANYEILPLSSYNYAGYESSPSVGNAYLDYYEDWNIGGRIREDWTHINCAQKLDNGNYLLSLRNLDLVIEVDPQLRNRVVWSFGPLVLKHQHCPLMLPNGNILIHDTGNGRIIEVTKEHEIVWGQGGQVSPYHGSCQRLDNGNTVYTDSLPSEVYEVTPDHELVWKIKVICTAEETIPSVPWKVVTGFRIYRAWKYGS